MLITKHAHTHTQLMLKLLSVLTRMYKISEPVCQIVLSKPLLESVHQPIAHLRGGADSHVPQSPATFLAIQNRIFVLTE